MNLPVRLLVAALAAMTFCACADKWSVDGLIEGAGEETIYLESQTNQGAWIAIDSLATDDGKFKFSRDKAEVVRPDIYRVRSTSGHTYYFPLVNGDDIITITADVSQPDTRYGLSGSSEADRMAKANVMISDIFAATDIEARDNLKRALYRDCMADDSLGLVSYYVVTKRVGGVPVYDPTVKRDLGIIGAVANSYTQNKPDDPRTALLNDYFLSNRRTRGVSMEATAAGFPEIVLTDENGTAVSLAETIDANKAVLLFFTATAAEGSGDLNLRLREIYDRHHADGLEIYQVEVGGDQTMWRHAAVNLPWITVYNVPGAEGDQVLLKYMVLTTDDLPAMFIISGDEGERITSLDQANSLVSKYL